MRGSALAAGQECNGKRQDDEENKPGPSDSQETLPLPGVSDQARPKRASVRTQTGAALLGSVRGCCAELESVCCRSPAPLRVRALGFAASLCSMCVCVCAWPPEVLLGGDSAAESTDGSENQHNVG